MVSRIASGKDIKGLVGYHESKVKNEKAERLFSNNLFMANSFENIYNQFQNRRELYQGKSNRTNFHGMISFAEEDNAKITKDKLQEITQRYMNGMGYENIPYQAYLHNDRDHTHVHIIAVGVDHNGSLIDRSFERRKSSAILRNMEKEYNLVELSSNVNQNAYRETAQKKKEKDIPQKPQTARDKIKSVATEILKDPQTINFKEFQNSLRKRGYDIGTVKNENKGVGYVYYELNENGKRISKGYPGSSLATGLAFDRVNERFKRNSTAQIVSEPVQENKKAMPIGIQLRILKQLEDTWSKEVKPNATSKREHFETAVNNYVKIYHPEITQNPFIFLAGKYSDFRDFQRDNEKLTEKDKKNIELKYTPKVAKAENGGPTKEDRNYIRNSFHDIQRLPLITRSDIDKLSTDNFKAEIKINQHGENELWFKKIDNSVIFKASDLNKYLDWNNLSEKLVYEEKPQAQKDRLIQISQTITHKLNNNLGSDRYGVRLEALSRYGIRLTTIDGQNYLKHYGGTRISMEEAVRAGIFREGETDFKRFREKALEIYSGQKTTFKPLEAKKLAIYEAIAKNDKMTIEQLSRYTDLPALTPSEKYEYRDGLAYYQAIKTDNKQVFYHTHLVDELTAFHNEKGKSLSAENIITSLNKVGVGIQIERENNQFKMVGFSFGNPQNGINLERSFPNLHEEFCKGLKNLSAHDYDDLKSRITEGKGFLTQLSEPEQNYMIACYQGAGHQIYNTRIMGGETPISPEEFEYFKTQNPEDFNNGLGSNSGGYYNDDLSLLDILDILAEANNSGPAHTIDYTKRIHSREKSDEIREIRKNKRKRR